MPTFLLSYLIRAKFRSFFFRFQANYSDTGSRLVMVWIRQLLFANALMTGQFWWSKLGWFPRRKTLHAQTALTNPNHFWTSPSIPRFALHLYKTGISTGKKSDHFYAPWEMVLRQFEEYPRKKRCFIKWSFFTFLRFFLTHSLQHFQHWRPQLQGRLIEQRGWIIRWHQWLYYWNSTTLILPSFYFPFFARLFSLPFFLSFFRLLLYFIDKNPARLNQNYNSLWSEPKTMKASKQAGRIKKKRRRRKKKLVRAWTWRMYLSLFLSLSLLFSFHSTTSLPFFLPFLSSSFFSFFLTLWENICSVISCCCCCCCCCYRARCSSSSNSKSVVHGSLSALGARESARKWFWRRKLWWGDRAVECRSHFRSKRARNCSLEEEKEREAQC